LKSEAMRESCLFGFITAVPLQIYTCARPNRIESDASQL
jgi:hypothetical protein